MRIAVNTRFLLKDRLEGIGTFSHQVLQRLVTQHSEHEFIFIFDRPWHEDFIYGSNVLPVSVFPQARHPLLFYWWFEWSLPRVFKKYKADIYFSPDGYLSLKSDLPQFPVFHDLAFEHFPKDVPALASAHYRHFFPRYAKKANRILTVSQFSKADISNLYGIAPSEIDVVYNGADDTFLPIDNFEKQRQVRTQFSNGHEYFLYVGALHQRKNITRLLRAYDRYLSFCNYCGHPNKELLIVGRKAWGTNEMESVYNGSNRLKTHVHFTGRLSQSELVKVTASAYAHVNVSYFEGFGIPILESMKCNVPIITSRNSPMEEVAGEAALTVNPLDEDDILHALKRMSFDPELRNQLAKKCGEVAAPFSWQRTSELVWDSFEKSGVLK